MAITDRRKFISDGVKSVIGFPIISVLEAEVSNIDLDHALLRYYTAAPMLRTRTYSTNYKDENLIDIKSLIDAEFPAQSITDSNIGTANGSSVRFSGNLSVPVKKGSVVIKRAGTQVATDDNNGFISGTDGVTVVSGNIDYSGGQISVIYNAAPPTGSITVDYIISNDYYFYLGIVNQDFRSNMTPIYNIDRYLLGIDTGLNLDNYDPLKQAAATSFDNRLTGRVTVELREVEGEKGTIHIISKGIGTLALTLGFGYNSYDKIPFNHLETFVGFVSEFYLERIIMARGIVSVDSDYRINLDLMTRKLDEIKQKNESNMINIATPVALLE